MKTLFLTQRFSAPSGAAPRRLRHLSRSMARKGQVYVIGAQGMDDLPPSHITAWKSIRQTDLRSLTLGENQTLPASWKKSAVIRSLMRMRQSFPFLLLTDDGGVAYRRAAYTLASEWIEKYAIDTIFSSFRPWSDHLLAHQLKKQFPDLHWIADFRDLPVDHHRKDVWWPSLQKKWAKSMIASANEIWTVSEGQARQMSGWHPHIQVHRNALLKLPPAHTSPQSEKFTIVYTGSLYPGLQSIGILIDILVQLEKEGHIIAEDFVMIYRGKDTAIWDKWMTRLPAAFGRDTGNNIAPALALKTQQNAQVLLLLNWASENYYGVLTAKLWDYLSTGRPILALINGPDDPELRKIIEGGDAGAVFGSDEAMFLRTWIQRAYTTWKSSNGVLPWSVDTVSLEPYLS